MTPHDDPPEGADDDAEADDAGTAGRFAYEGLQRVFHEKARLSIMTSLVAHPRGLIFADLRDLCALTDGNLSRHLQVLNEAGFVEIAKGFQQNRPQTVCHLTENGRHRFLEYINVLESVVADALAAARSAPDPASSAGTSAATAPRPRTKTGQGIAEGWSPA